MADSGRRGHFHLHHRWAAKPIISRKRSASGSSPRTREGSSPHWSPMVCLDRLPLHLLCSHQFRFVRAIRPRLMIPAGMYRGSLVPRQCASLFATAMVRRTMALRPASGRSTRPSRSSLFGRPRRQFEHGHANNAFSIWLRLVAVVNWGGANRAAHLWEAAQNINYYDPS